MVLCIRDAFYESRSLEMERKVGGNFRPRLLISVKPIANKYHEGNSNRSQYERNTSFRYMVNAIS